VVLFVQIIVIVLLVLVSVLFIINAALFFSALRRSWRSDEKSHAGLLFSFFLFQASVVCALFLLPFAVVCGRWADTGGLDILSVEIVLILAVFSAGILYALFLKKRAKQSTR